MTVKTRYPQGTLYHSDYLTWVGKVVGWLETQIAQPDYPAHLAPGLAPLVDDLHDALLAWDDLNEDQKGRSTVFSDSAGEVAKKLQFLKDIFPTTISDPMAMAEFGLDRKVPVDRDELYVMAQTCLGQWVETTGGGVPPEYLPLEGFFTGFTALFADFMTKRGLYYTKLNAAQQAQNNVLLTRAACHELERKIFNWYRAHHKNTKDEWWTATWWGASSGGSGGGGGGEEEEPQPEEFPAWPGPTGVFTLRYWGEGVVEIVYGGVQESTIGWLHRSVPGAEDWIEVTKNLPMNEEDILPFREMHVPIGMWEYRFIPMRGVEKGVASFALIEVV